MKEQGVTEGKGLTQRWCFPLDIKKYQLQAVLHFRLHGLRVHLPVIKNKMGFPTSEISQVFLLCLGP